MDLKQAAYLAYDLLTTHGLDDWTFAFDRAKSRAGCCFHRRKQITLSFHYVLRNADKPDDIRDTILHEIAHAIAGHAAAHGPDWKSTCVKIGARPERCYNSAIIDMPKGRFSAVCDGCQRVFRRHKRPRKGRFTYCAKCGPDVGRLKYI